MSSSLRAKYKRPSPLEFKKPHPEPRLSTISILPNTVYRPEDDEIDDFDDPSTPETPTDVTGLFRGYSPSSSSSSLSAREISPPITPTNEVYHGRKIKRKGSSANMRGGPGLNYTNKTHLGKYASQAPTTPTTPLSGLDAFPANVFAVITPAVTPVSNSNMAEFQTVPFHLAPLRPSTAPEPHKIIVDERAASPKPNSVPGIGVKYPLRRRGHLSQALPTKKQREEIMGDWEVSDDDDEIVGPPQTVELKPWVPLQVARKSSAPAALSAENAGEAAPLDSISDTTSELNFTCGVPLLNLDSVSSDSTSTPSVHENIVEEEEEEGGTALEIEQPVEQQIEAVVEEVIEQVVKVEDEGIARAMRLMQPMYSQSAVDVTTPASTPKKSPFAFGGHSDIELPQRSPSAPIVSSVSAVPFDTSEDLPVMFSDLPVDETDIFNIIPNEYIMADVLGKNLEELDNSDYPISPEHEEYLIHPDWQVFGESEHKSAVVTRKKNEPDEMVAMMDHEPPIARGFRSRFNSTPSILATEQPIVPSPASFRPNSRWSDYSVDDDTKESWRSSVLNRFHLPHVGMDLKKAVAAAKGGIINRRHKPAVESSPLVEEETMSIHGGSPSPRNSTATDTDSIAETTIAALAIPPHPNNNNRNSTASAGSGLTGFRINRITSGKAASIRTVATGRAGTTRGTSSDEELSDDERRVKGSFKGVFEKYVARDAKKRKEQRRREELKRTIRVIGGGKGGDWL